MSNTTSTSQGGYPAGTKIYRALLTQTGTSAPLAVVLTNTFGGEIIWTRNIASQYRGTLPNAFKANKVFLYIPPYDAAADDTATGVHIKRLDVNRVEINIIAGHDDALLNTPVEIIVYP